MVYGTTTLAANRSEREPWQVRILRVLLWFIPLANPDNERLYPRVRRWALELDAENRPQREIGLGSNGEALFRAPDGPNFGFWTDSSEPFDVKVLKALDVKSFEALWNGASRNQA